MVYYTVFSLYSSTSINDILRGFFSVFTKILSSLPNLLFSTKRCSPILYFSILGSRNHIALPVLERVVWWVSVVGSAPIPRPSYKGRSTGQNPPRRHRNTEVPGVRARDFQQRRRDAECWGERVSFPLPPQIRRTQRKARDHPVIITEQSLTLGLPLTAF